MTDRTPTAVDAALLQQADDLKQALTDFVLDAEGDLATALESFSAAQLSRSQQQDLHRRSLVVDRFLVEGEVANSDPNSATAAAQTPIDLFLAETELAPADRSLVQSWQRGFVGLFAVLEILAQGLVVKNWMTDKIYTVWQPNAKAWEDMARIKPGEILLMQIAPLTDTDWMIFSPWTALGKLGKPKLAVAIGNFKQNYQSQLYGDAPELLEEAWRSVEQYHQAFIDFFGSDEVTMPGYQLNKKLNEFQEQSLQTRMAEAGIDSSKSLDQMAAEAGLDEADLEAAAEALGADAQSVKQALNSKASAKMVAPTIDLPAPLKKAEQVTVLIHPRYGQVFLPHYYQFKALLEAEDWTTVPNGTALVQRYLTHPEVTALVWQRLAAQYPTQLEAILRTVLARPDFQLKTDLDRLLAEHNKALDNELPEIASVPVHLHDLFQEAVLEISKDKSKTKTSKKASSGFGRSASP